MSVDAGAEGGQVDPDRVEAAYKNGLLRVRLLRAEADKPRKIEVKSQ